MHAARHSDDLAYALVTPARDEAAHIERLIRSVARQSRPPLRWAVVDDGSADGTEEIVRRWAERHPWIELIESSRAGERSFAGKARAFALGCRALAGLPWDVVGNLDADVSFDADCLAFLLERFAANPRLGVAGPVVLASPPGSPQHSVGSLDHVSGGCQLFRRACLDAVGGYLPVEGGVDWAAAATARRLGWETRTFREKACLHHRPLGTASHGPWRAWFQRGETDYRAGNHPLWQLLRSVYQSASKPRLVRGALLFAGYASAALRRCPRAVPVELVRFHRAAQRRQLRRWASPTARRGRSAARAAELSVSESLFRLRSWVEAHDYKGYEPFDGLSSPLRRLAFRRRPLEQLLLQAVRRCPVNLRPLLGIRPLDSTKARGLMARGYLALWRRTGDDEYRGKARACLDWLMDNRCAGQPGHSWGNHFDFASRAGRYAAGEPILVWTSLIGQAFLDAWEDLRDERYLRVAESVCDWILALPRETTSAGSCLSYLPSRQLSIHNANLLGAAMLARTARHTGAAEARAVAAAAAAYSCSAQRADGSWLYGEEPRYHWIDSFHTGYNLDGLRVYLEAGGEPAFRSHLERGYDFFRAHFFERDGAPKYYHDRTYPIDIQCAAQAIETFAGASGERPEALREASRVARWTLRHMQDPSGFFYYRRSRLWTARTPMLHWGQATMFRGLALLHSKLAPDDGGREAPRRREPAAHRPVSPAAG